MGWYVTCEYCCNESKYRLECNCEQEKAIEWQTIWIGSTVVGHRVQVDIFGTWLYYHIVKEGKDYYFCMGLLESGDNGQGPFYTMISKERFEGKMEDSEQKDEQVDEVEVKVKVDEVEVQEDEDAEEQELHLLLDEDEDEE